MVVGHLRILYRIVQTFHQFFRYGEHRTDCGYSFHSQNLEKIFSRQGLVNRPPLFEATLLVIISVGSIAVQTKDTNDLAVDLTPDCQTEGQPVSPSWRTTSCHSLYSRYACQVNI